MIHLALIVAAILFLGWVALMLFGLIGTSFEQSKGCGCLVLIIVLVMVAIVLAIAL
jgi:hypothetical protein